MASAAASTHSRPHLSAKISPRSTSSTSSPSRSPTAMGDLGGKVLLQWRPVLNGPELLVVQGDLTSCKADAIVNAANIHLNHGGGLAGAIVRKGSSSIQQESSKWIKENGPLNVGDAITTAAGKLPCKHVIHTVGPNVGDVEPTAEHSAQLRRAVWSALIEADALEIESVAVPGISTGIFGYPRDLGAGEIVKESVRFCHEKGKTTVKRIALMNIDDPTVNSFIKALKEAKKRGDGKQEKDISDELAELDIRG